MVWLVVAVTLTATLSASGAAHASPLDEGYGQGGVRASNIADYAQLVPALATASTGGVIQAGMASGNLFVLVRSRDGRVVGASKARATLGVHGGFDRAWWVVPWGDGFVFSYARPTRPEGYEPDVLGRLSAGGRFDWSFGDGGVAGREFRPMGLVIAREGVLPAGGGLLVSVGGTGGDVRGMVGLARLDGQGRLDRSFGDGGFALHAVRRVAAAPDGYRWVLVSAAVPLPGGRLLLVGDAAPRGSSDPSIPFVARVFADGRLDRSFGAGGFRFPTLAYPRLGLGDPILQRLGGGRVRVLVAVGGSGLSVLMALDPDGVIDRSFGRRGFIALPSKEEVSIREIRVDPRGRIVLSGRRGGTGVLQRHLRDGARDPSFGAGGRACWHKSPPAVRFRVGDVVFQPDGRLVQGAGFFRDGGPDVPVVWALAGFRPVSPSAIACLVIERIPGSVRGRALAHLARPARVVVAVYDRLRRRAVGLVNLGVHRAGQATAGWPGAAAGMPLALRPLGRYRLTAYALGAENRVLGHSEPYLFPSA